jgi:hypothetical protein
MGIIKRALGYASIGAAKVATKRAWESESYVESALSAAEAGMWAESAKNLLSSEIKKFIPQTPQSGKDSQDE